MTECTQHRSRCSFPLACLMWLELLCVEPRSIASQALWCCPSAEVVSFYVGFALDALTGTTIRGQAVVPTPWTTTWNCFLKSARPTRCEIVLPCGLLGRPAQSGVAASWAPCTSCFATGLRTLVKLSVGACAACTEIPMVVSPRLALTCGVGFLALTLSSLVLWQESSKLRAAFPGGVRFHVRCAETGGCGRRCSSG
jgi:hypothetical protein